MPRDLHARIRSLLDFWREGQKQAEEVAREQRQDGEGEWMTGSADQGRVMIGHLEDVLRNRWDPEDLEDE